MAVRVGGNDPFFANLIGFYRVANHKFIVSQRLNFKVIVKLGYFQKFSIIGAANYSLIKVACLASTTDDKSFAVLFNFTFSGARSFIKILHMRFGNKLIKVFKTY